MVINYRWNNVPFYYNLTKIKWYAFMIVLIHELILFLIMPPFPGIIRMFSPLLVSSSTASGLAVTAIAIAVILLASTVTITNAQQLEQQQQQMSRRSRRSDTHCTISQLVAQTRICF